MSGKPAAVVIAGPAGEVVVRGVDGPSLDWRVGDTVVVDGPEPEAGSVDCTDATRCSVGLRSGGDVVLADVDAHAVAGLAGRLGLRSMVVGRSRRASLEVRATSKDVLARSLAAAFGLGLKRYKSLVLLARPAVLATAKPRRVAVPGRTVDLDLRGAHLQDLMRLFSDIAQVPTSGDLLGEVTVVARGVDSGEPLDAMFGLCGVDFTRAGPALELSQSGGACSEAPLPERRCPRTEARPTRAVHAGLACIELSKLEVKALAFPRTPGAGPFAMIGQGAPRGDELVLSSGDFLSHSELRETEGGTYELSWRVSAIGRDGVDLVLEDPGLPHVPPKRARLLLR